MPDPTPEDMARDLEADLASYQRIIHALDAGIADMAFLAVGALPAALRRAQAAERFKAWVHAWLDAAGVPHDPDPTHTREHGCRIWGRMQHLLARAQAAEARLRQYQEYIAKARIWLRDTWKVS